MAIAFKVPPVLGYHERLENRLPDRAAPFGPLGGQGTRPRRVQLNCAVPQTPRERGAFARMYGYAVGWPVLQERSLSVQSDRRPLTPAVCGTIEFLSCGIIMDAVRLADFDHLFTEVSHAL